MEYENVSDLERHIKSVHEDHEKFECENCNKSFVTKWRLEKHVKMHSKLNLRECHYYKSKSYCPFDDLGCKFGHKKVEDTDEIIDDTNEMVNDSHSDISKDNPTNPFCTSTPIKKQNILLKCEDCLNISQCTACRIIQQIEERHKIMHQGRQDILV